MEHFLKVLSFLLHKNAPVDRPEVSDRCELNKALVVLAVDELEEQGIVERIADPNDRRVNLIAFRKKKQGKRFSGQDNGQISIDEIKLVESKVIFSALSDEERLSPEKLIYQTLSADLTEL